MVPCTACFASRAVFEIRSDSNTDGVGSSSNVVAAGVQVTVSFSGKNYRGTTDSNGVFRTTWNTNLGSGSCYANLIDLAMEVYNLLAFDLDLEDDSGADGKPDDVLTV